MAKLKQFIKRKQLLFVAAGIGNTAIDFAIFNMAILVLGLKPWLANIVSTSIAMIGSFLMNKHVVFGDKRTGRYLQFVVFVGVTIIGLWGLQTVIVLGVSTFLHPVARHIFGLAERSAQLAASNAAKAVATVASAVWNYWWYDHVIFARTPVKGKLEEWL